MRVMEYDMRRFLEQCLELFAELAGPIFAVKPEKTPFIEEDDRENPTRSPQISDDGGLVCLWCVGCFPKATFTAIEHASEAAAVSKRVREQIIVGGNSKTDAGTQEAGPWLDTIAARVVMIMYFMLLASPAPTCCALSVTCRAS